MPHTPGPWKAVGTKALGLAEVIALDCDFIAGHLVCSVNQSWGGLDSATGLLPRPQVEANARLIAKAPEMLALLEKWGAGYGDGKFEGRVWDGDPVLRQTEALLADLQAKPDAILPK